MSDDTQRAFDQGKAVGREEAERERRILPADYEGFWERRYNEQHRTLHSCEDALKEARERAERAEAAVRDLSRAAKDVQKTWRASSLTDRMFDSMGQLAEVLARHPSFSGEDGTET